MSDRTNVLYVRVPRALKERMEQFRAVQGVSLTQAANTLLENGLRQPPPTSPFSYYEQLTRIAPTDYSIKLTWCDGAVEISCARCGTKIALLYTDRAVVLSPVLMQVTIAVHGKECTEELTNA